MQVQVQSAMYMYDMDGFAQYKVRFCRNPASLRFSACVGFSVSGVNAITTLVVIVVIVNVEAYSHLKKIFVFYYDKQWPINSTNKCFMCL